MRAREFIKEAKQATAKQVLSYINKTHHEPFQPGENMHAAVLAHPRWELQRVPLLNLNIPDQEYDDVDYYENPPESDPYNRVMTVDPSHAGEVSLHLVDRYPIVIDADRYIIDGNHRAWAAKYLLNRDYIMAWVPVNSKQTVAEARIPRAIENFLDSLSPDDVGVEEFGPYRVHFEGFTDDCKSSKDYCRDPDAVYQQVYADFIQREGGARPLVQDMVGDEDYPILYSIFKIKKQPMRESLDQPYPLTWEKSEADDSMDALARLPDGSNLSIMFNQDLDDEGQGIYSVEFWRNNSQEVTGAGDSQRVFATVLSAIAKFIKKRKPEQLYFSANKDVEPGQKAGSRSNLYTSLVRRYASALGYEADVSDFAGSTTYKLYRLNEHDVVEAANAGPQIVYATGSRTQGINDVDLVFKDLRTNRIVAHVVGNNRSLAEFAPPGGGGDGSGGLPDRGATYEIRMGNANTPTYVAFGDPQQDREHQVYKLGSVKPGAPEYYGHGLTLISRLDWWSFLEKMLGEIMWEDDAIEAGYVDRLDNGDLVFVKQQGVTENFADGKVKGRSRPGRVKRAGASCAGSVTDLRAKAKKYGGERGKMYHWCANMKSGRKKNK